ncbi:MAG: AAA family ATPase [Vicinamibacterales bacterium]
MYESYFGLRVRPFDLTPDPRFLFMTAGHREALSTIEYGIAGRKGLTLLVGPAGTGKTTLVHAALERQKGVEAAAIYLSNPTLTREEFFQFLAFEVGLADAAEKSKTLILRELRATLLERHKAGRLTALLVDEAQAMPDELLQELRMLENLEVGNEKLLPVVLVGQVELVDRLRQPALMALKQRVALRSTLAPLTAQEAAAYIAERIRIAGGDVAKIFTPEAVAAIGESSGGIPRNISVICDNAMVSGFALDEQPIAVATIVEVCRDFDFPLPRLTATARVGSAQSTAGAVAAPPPPRVVVQAAVAPPAPRVVPQAAAPPPLRVVAHAAAPSSPRGVAQAAPAAPAPRSVPARARATAQPEPYVSLSPSILGLQMPSASHLPKKLVVEPTPEEAPVPARSSLFRFSLPARVRGLRSLFVRMASR